LAHQRLVRSLAAATEADLIAMIEENMITNVNLMRHYYRLILRKLPYIKTEPTRTNTLQLLERAEEQSKKTPNAIAIEFRSRFAANTLPVFEDDPYL
jgi:hypothetical protein